MTPAQTDEMRVDIMPCPFCGGADYRIEPGGQTWRGVKGYSAPQYFHFYHNGVVPEGDGFQSCSVQIRARTETECTSIWNNSKMEAAQ